MSNTKVFIIGDTFLPQLDGGERERNVIEKRDIVFEAYFPITNTRLQLCKNINVRFCPFEGSDRPVLKSGQLLDIENGEFLLKMFDGVHTHVKNIVIDGIYIQSESFMDRRILTDKESEYMSYIAEHIRNVNKAFEMFGKELKKFLVFELERLEIRARCHDASKLSEYEFGGYRRNFYPDAGEIPSNESFERAWLHHYRFNPHHPEFHNDFTQKAGFPMPDIDIAEMFIDWCAMSMKFGGRPDIWFKNKGRYTFHLNKKTEEKIFDILNNFNWDLWKDVCHCGKNAG